MDDVYGAGTPSARKQCLKYLSRAIEFKDGDGRVCSGTTARTSGTTTHTTKKRDASATEQQVSGHSRTSVGADDSETCIITKGHIASCDGGRDTTDSETALCRSCVGAHMYHVQDRPDAQLDLPFLVLI